MNKVFLYSVLIVDSYERECKRVCIVGGVNAEQGDYKLSLARALRETTFTARQAKYAKLYDFKIIKEINK